VTSDIVTIICVLLGLSVGDEIGFNQSLSNLENSGRRRSVGTATSLQVSKQLRLPVLVMMF